MVARLEDVFRALGQALRGVYPALVTAAAGYLLVLLLWPQSPRTYLAEATAIATSHHETLATADDALAWLRSDEVLRAAIANLRASQPHSLTAIQGDSAAGDPIAALRDRLHLVPLASPDEMPRLAIGFDLPARRAAMAVADELGKQLTDHYAAQRRRERLARFGQQERQAGQELEEAQAAQERLEVELQGLRHAQLTSAVASNVSSPPAAASVDHSSAADRRLTELARTLESLKIERDRLLEVFLPAHPQIRALSAQISRLEETLRRYAPDPEAGSLDELPAREVRSGGSKVLLQWRRNQGSADVLASGQAPLQAAGGPDDELAAALRQSQLDLLAATQRHDQARQRWQSLEEERKQIESESDLAWSVQPARIASVGGGAQAGQQLAVALIAASIGGLAMAWLARLAERDRLLSTAAELRLRVALPVLGTLVSGDDESNAPQPATRAQAALQFATRSAEVVLLTFLLTLLAAVALDRGLLSDLTHDPLATLGELVQRLI